MSAHRLEVEQTTRFFDATAEYWREVYAQPRLDGVIYRQRMETTLRWVDELRLARGASVLDAGCGAGHLAGELAARGFRVTATDASQEMLDRAMGHARGRGVADSMTFVCDDVHRLDLESQSFDLVTALGLLPWVTDDQAMVDELNRVLRPGAWMILTSDNRIRLGVWLEPRHNPLLGPVKSARNRGRQALGHSPEAVGDEVWHMHTPWQVDRLLAQAGLRPARRATLGFGPFTFLGRALMAPDSAVRLHLHLQRRSSRSRLLRRSGWHYIVQAQRT